MNKLIIGGFSLLILQPSLYAQHMYMQFSSAVGPKNERDYIYELPKSSTQSDSHYFQSFDLSDPQSILRINRNLSHIHAMKTKSYENGNDAYYKEFISKQAETFQNTNHIVELSQLLNQKHPNSIASQKKWRKLHELNKNSKLGDIVLFLLVANSSSPFLLEDLADANSKIMRLLSKVEETESAQNRKSDPLKRNNLILNLALLDQVIETLDSNDLTEEHRDALLGAKQFFALSLLGRIKYEVIKLVATSRNNSISSTSIYDSSLGLSEPNLKDSLESRFDSLRNSLSQYSKYNRDSKSLPIFIQELKKQSLKAMDSHYSELLETFREDLRSYIRKRKLDIVEVNYKKSLIPITETDKASLVDPKSKAQIDSDMSQSKRERINSYQLSSLASPTHFEQKLDYMWMLALNEIDKGLEAVSYSCKRSFKR